MKLLTMLMALILPLISFAENRLSLEVISTKHGEEVWVSGLDRTGAKRIGTVEVLKKGTYLYHWGNATPEQAESWNKAGRITPENLDKLRGYRGMVGGGFYVSTNPIDSASFGNTVIVIELPKDIRIVRSWSNRLEADFWNGISDQLMKMGFSGAGVASRETWLTITDASALTKEFVPQKDFFETLQIDKIFYPSEADTKNFRKIRADYASLPSFKRVWERSESIPQDLLSADRSAAAFDLVAADSSATMMKWTVESADLSGLTVSFIEACGSAPGCLNKLLSRIDKSHPKYPSVVSEALRSKDGDIRGKILYSLARNNSVADLVPALQEAEKFWGEKIPYGVGDYIERHKKKYQWHSQVVCSQVFGG